MNRQPERSPGEEPSDGGRAPRGHPPEGTTEVGIDIIKVDRIRASIARFGARFEKRVLTTNEARYVRLRPETFARKLFTFLHNITGHYFPVRFTLLYPIYYAYAMYCVADWVWSMSRYASSPAPSPYTSAWCTSCCRS